MEHTEKLNGNTDNYFNKKKKKDSPKIITNRSRPLSPKFRIPIRGL